MLRLLLRQSRHHFTNPRDTESMRALAFVVAALQQPVAPAPRAPAAPPPIPALPPQVGDTSPFRRLALPASNLIREGSGRPGPRYWQQRADYDLRSSLDTATHAISGTETLRYTDRKSTRLNSSHVAISYAVFCLKKQKTQ